MSKYNRQLTELEDSLRSKQDQIQELLSRIDEKDGEIARVAEEKEQELMIMQEGMDTTLKELSDMRLVSAVLYRWLQRRGGVDAIEVFRHRD